MNTDKNTALYEKMAAEQDKFRDWLKSQPPEEILKHTYEYTVREDILMAMEELDLPQSRAAALLASSSPLADVYKEFSDRETSYMDVVRDSIEQRPMRRWTPSGNCRSTATTPPMPANRRPGFVPGVPPRQHRLQGGHRGGHSEHYRDNRLDKDAVPQVIEQFGYTRILYVLANTVQQKSGMSVSARPTRRGPGRWTSRPTRTALAANATWTLWWTATPAWSICS